MAERTYSREEMEEIFRRAAEHTTFTESGADAIRYEDLVAAANEVGIDPKAVEHVAAGIEAERAQIAQRADDDAIVRHELAERRHRARRSLLTYVIVATFLAGIDWLTPGGPWAQWVALIWGFFVALSLGRAMLEPSHAERERILTRERRRRARQEREAQRKRAATEWKSRLEAQQEAIRHELAQQEARRREREESRRASHRERERASREFEQAVEDGVTQLLTAVARRIKDSSLPEAPGPRGDFGDFVRRERARSGASGGRTDERTPPRVRVQEPGRGSRRSADDSDGAQDDADDEARERARRARSRR